MIQRLTCGATFDRYDANVMPHIHFVCKNCAKVTDIHDSLPSEKLKEAIAGIGLHVDTYDLTCYGICDECRGS